MAALACRLKLAYQREGLSSEVRAAAAPGGWGFADFTNGRPGNEALHAKDFPATRLQKIANVFTHDAPTP
jgi:hypothetical protein